jgi:hypothetical protein
MGTAEATGGAVLAAGDGTEAAGSGERASVAEGASGSRLVLSSHPGRIARASAERR